MKCAFCDAERINARGPALLVRSGTDRAICMNCFVVLIDAAEPLLGAEIEYQSWIRPQATE